MSDRFLTLTVLTWIWGMLWASPVLSAERPQWQYGLSFSYLTGDYGQEGDTDILFAAATVKRYLDWGDLTLTVPYVDISADGVTFVGGDVESVADGGGGSGLGDIVLKGRYYAVEQDDLLPFIDLVGSVKVPTADEDKGLGTGEFDFTCLVEVARVLSDERWIVLAELGYTFVGEPSAFDLDNRWIYSIGLAYKLSSDITVSGYLDGRTATVDGRDNPLSVLIAGEYKYRSDLRLDGMLEIGLNDGAPDFGATLGIRKRM